MRLPLLLLIAIGLIDCSQSDDAHARAEAERTREEAHQTAEKLKVESKEALRQAEIDAHKASREIDKDLKKAREKTRQALDQPDNTEHR
jgi:uncharacterized membrane protein